MQGAFDALDKCREEHKNEDGDDPFPPATSVFDGDPIIPFQDPDPDDEIVIFDDGDEEILIFDEEDFIVIEDEDGNLIFDLAEE